jgi:hypothetical protein
MITKEQILAGKTRSDLLALRTAATGCMGCTGCTDCMGCTGCTDCSFMAYNIQLTEAEYRGLPL